MDAREAARRVAKALGPKSVINVSEAVIHWVETVAAFMLVFLFFIGVFDLGLQIYGIFQSGLFTDPNAIIDILDVVLLFLIIVEVYETVVAYAKEEDQRKIVLTVVYAGAIAMIRKIIIFRPTEYDTPEAAFITAGSYVVILFGLAGILFVTYRYGGVQGEEPSETPRDNTVTGEVLGGSSDTDNNDA